MDAMDDAMDAFFFFLLVVRRSKRFRQAHRIELRITIREYNSQFFGRSSQVNKNGQERCSRSPSGSGVLRLLPPPPPSSSSSSRFTRLQAVLTFTVVLAFNAVYRSAQTTTAPAIATTTTITAAEPGILGDEQRAALDAQIQAFSSNIRQMASVSKIKNEDLLLSSSSSSSSSSLPPPPTTASPASGQRP